MNCIFNAILSFFTELYRANNGKIIGVAGLNVLLLTTIGKKSGKIRGGYVITASNAGLDRHPAWFLNLRANPKVHLNSTIFVRSLWRALAPPRLPANRMLPGCNVKRVIWAHNDKIK